MKSSSKSTTATEKNAWLLACKQDTLTAYLRFLSRFPNSEFRKNALDRSNELEEERAWKAAQRSDRIYTYEKFLDDFPEGKYARIAGKRIIKLEKHLLKTPPHNQGDFNKFQLEELALEEATNKDSIAAYNQFLKNFPQSSYGKQIRERMHQLESRLAVQYRFLEIELQNWEVADKLDTPLAYRDFLQKFPEGKFSLLAAQRLETFGEKVNGKSAPEKVEPERISINPNSSPLVDVLQIHSKEKQLEEKSAKSLAYVWLGLFIVNACLIYLLAPVFLHFVMALALLSAGYFMYARNKELSNRELSIYGYGMCLAIWISTNEILSFLSLGTTASWIIASIVSLLVLTSLIRYVEGFAFDNKDSDPS